MVDSITTGQSKEEEEEKEETKCNDVNKMPKWNLNVKQREQKRAKKNKASREKRTTKRFVNQPMSQVTNMTGERRKYIKALCFSFG